MEGAVHLEPLEQLLIRHHLIQPRTRSVSTLARVAQASARGAFRRSCRCRRTPGGTAGTPGRASRGTRAHRRCSTRRLARAASKRRGPRCSRFEPTSTCCSRNLTAQSSRNARREQQRIERATREARSCDSHRHRVTPNCSLATAQQMLVTEPLKQRAVDQILVRRALEKSEREGSNYLATESAARLLCP